MDWTERERIENLERLIAENQESATSCENHQLTLNAGWYADRVAELKDELARLKRGA